jgi:hypothetical protein
MILIFPWSRPTDAGKPSPKNYPYWKGVVGLFKQKINQDIYRTHQISCKGEPDIGCSKRSDNLPLTEIQGLLKSCHAWISVDSFVPHMAWTIGEPGVVIFGPSDPAIFGHAGNTNLLKHRKYLRENQFWLWSQYTNPDPQWFMKAFVDPAIVVNAVMLSIAARVR